MKDPNGQFRDDSLASFNEAMADRFDFKQCRRTNGTIYGVPDDSDCAQKGAREVKPKEAKKKNPWGIENVARKSGAELAQIASQRPEFSRALINKYATDKDKWIMNKDPVTQEAWDAWGDGARAIQRANHEVNLGHAAHNMAMTAYKQGMYNDALSLLDSARVHYERAQEVVGWSRNSGKFNNAAVATLDEIWDKAERAEKKRIKRAKRYRRAAGVPDPKPHVPRPRSRNSSGGGGRSGDIIPIGAGLGRDGGPSNSGYIGDFLHGMRDGLGSGTLGLLESSQGYQREMRVKCAQAGGAWDGKYCRRR